MAAALVIVLVISLTVGVWALYMLLDWLLRGCPNRRDLWRQYD